MPERRGLNLPPINTKWKTLDEVAVPMCKSRWLALQRGYSTSKYALTKSVRASAVLTGGPVELLILKSGGRHKAEPGDLLQPELMFLKKEMTISDTDGVETRVLMQTV